ncbi:hypothetical protein AG1IA_09191 [Rhizoctonia solani AG-1 IA]|uniref:Uncharacterized protein n=1 Tax=Thanatephorus cucumeris (strain AG1-IA) TaxID=983506 RepID=L8WKB1_THACA|nr:hypothetical protein AG1IA_09191 [Rhizoctonia solani AG-1 IA]
MLSSIGLSQDDVKDYRKAGMKDFEAGAKRGFQDESIDQYINVGNSRFNNTTIRARRGRLTLPGYVHLNPLMDVSYSTNIPRTIVKPFFDTCTKEIISSVNQQIDTFPHPTGRGVWGQPLSSQ